MDLEPPPLPWPEVSVPQELDRVGEFRKGYSWVPVIPQELSCLGSVWRHQHGRPHGLSSSGRRLVQGSGGEECAEQEPWSQQLEDPHPGPLPLLCPRPTGLARGQRLEVVIVTVKE